MKRSVIVLLALSVVLAFGVPAMAEHDGGEGTSAPPLPGANGQGVWEYIAKWNKYTSWPLWPGKGKLFEGTEPHGALLTVYLSQDAVEVVKGKKGTFGEGAFVIKENYKPDKTLAAITLMYKKKGYNPEAGDWFWAKYNADGSVDKAGKVGGCINCHKQAADNDWVFTGEIK